jgi:hypothetical protein
MYTWGFKTDLIAQTSLEHVAHVDTGGAVNGETAIPLVALG